MKTNHIGMHLHEIVKCQTERINVVVKRAGFSLSTFYRHTNCARLPKEILEKYARAMNIEFLPSVLYNDNESEIIIFFDTLCRVKQSKDY